ncbi:MAG: HAMP domain-containing histidine kinase [Lentisphaeraceae bacterium]|nr:HAMP domain-containing histidine kinase [Lentisphaeraceae bacterium]
MNPNTEQNNKLELLGQMTGAILHDLKSPLAYIVSNNNHLEKKLRKLDDEKLQNQLLEVIDENKVGLKQIKEILNNIGSLLKNDQDMKPCFLGAIVETSLNIIKPQANQKDVKLDYNFSTQDDCIMGVASQISQVIINILINAIEAYSEGSAERLIKVNLSQNNDKLSLSIKDNAAGISPEKISKIFDWYETSKETGTGQGLAISKEIVTRHNAQISCTSTLGEGTEFQIDFQVDSK